MMFNIKSFFSSVSKTLLDDAINNAQEQVQIKIEDVNII